MPNAKRKIYTMPRLRQQNKVADTGRYGTEKLSPLLPEVQAGNSYRCKKIRCFGL